MQYTYYGGCVIIIILLLLFYCIFLYISYIPTHRYTILHSVPLGCRWIFRIYFYIAIIEMKIYSHVPTYTCNIYIWRERERERESGIYSMIVFTYCGLNWGGGSSSSIGNGT